MTIQQIIDLLNTANHIANVAIDAAEELQETPTEILDAIDDLNKTSVRL